MELQDRSTVNVQGAHPGLSHQQTASRVVSLQEEPSCRPRDFHLQGWKRHHPRAWHTLHPCPVCTCPALCISIIIQSHVMLCSMFMDKKSATNLSDAPHSLCKQKRRSSCIPFLQTCAISPLSGSAIVSPLFKNPLC